MSFVDVLPVEPTTATTCALAPRADEAARAASATSWSSGTSVAAPRARASLDVANTGVERDEELSGADLPRVGLHASRAHPPRRRRAGRDRGRRSRPRRAGSRLAASARARASRASRATSRSSNGWRTPSISCPCSWPLPAITTTSPGSARPMARSIADRRSGSISTPVPAPWSTSSMMASGLSERGLSEVTIADVRRARRRPSPSAVALPDPDPRLLRRRRSPAPRRARARRSSTVSSESGVWA